MRVVVVAVALAAVACTDPVRETPLPEYPAGWSDAPAIGGGPRQETAVVALDGKIYVVGGLDQNAVSRADVEVYDPASESWSVIAPLPEPMHHANAVVHNGRIYVLGFLKGLSFSADNGVYSIDPLIESSWTAHPEMPSARGGGGAASLGDAIYVFGGVRGGAAVSEVARFFPDDDERWEPLSEMPDPLDHLIVATASGAAILAGGRRGSIGSHQATTWIFDPVTGDYDEGAPMPTSRAGAAGAMVNGALVIVGGEGNVDDDNGVFHETELYDPLSDSWSTGPDMPTPRHGMGAAAVDGTLYVPGGADIQGLAAIAVHEAFTP